MTVAAIHFPHNHFVYIMGRWAQDEWIPPAKVGITSNLHSRLRTIQTSCPVKLEIVEAIAFPDKQMAQAVETATHRNLQNVRLLGEWFNIEPTAAYRTAIKLLEELLAPRFEDPWDLRDTLTLMGNVKWEVAP